MTKQELFKKLSNLFPMFAGYWKVESDPNDKSEVANAICTSFLELLDEQKEGRVIEKYLGKECKAFLDAMRGYS